MPEHLYFVKAPAMGFQHVTMVKDDYLAQTSYAGNSIVANGLGGGGGGEPWSVLRN